MHMFDLIQQIKYSVIKIPSPGANVRQILGVPGEIWGAESAADKIISIKTEP